MENKQTAVEWIVEQLTPSISLQQKHIDNLKNEAKEMEKQQIIDAYKEGCFDNILDEKTDTVRAEQYYNQTFKSE
jgi:hypothetical protein